MSQRYVRLEPAPPLDPKYYDRPWYCEPYVCDGCARQFGLQGPAHARLIARARGRDVVNRLCPECVNDLRDGSGVDEQPEIVCVWCGLNSGKHESRFLGAFVIHHCCLDRMEIAFREGKVTAGKELVMGERTAYNSDKADALKMALGQ